MSISIVVAIIVLGYGVAVTSHDLFAGNPACLFWMVVAVGLSLPCREERSAHLCRGHHDRR